MDILWVFLFCPEFLPLRIHPTTRWLDYKSNHTMAPSHSGFFLFYHYNFQGSCLRTVIQTLVETAGLVCNQAHGRDNKASKTTSRKMLQQAPNTQHAARSTACCLDSLASSVPARASLLTTILLYYWQLFGAPCMSIFGFLRRTSSYFHDMTLIVTRVTLTSIRHL